MMGNGEEKTNDPRIAFLGTPDLAVIVLRELVSRGIVPDLVVTAPDRPAGRGKKLTPPPLKQAAKELGIPCEQPETPSGLDAILRERNIGLGLVAAYGRILPARTLEIPRYGFLNVHPSLLPRHRGASPIQETILQGDATAGTTIMLMDEKMDHGPILSSEEVAIGQMEFSHGKGKPAAPELQKLLAELGGRLLAEAVPQWIQGAIAPRPQDHGSATFTKQLTREDGHISWDEPASLLERKMRAYDPWPGIFTFLPDKKGTLRRIKILDAYAIPSSSADPPGSISLAEDALRAQTKEGAFCIRKLQPEGRQSMEAKDFLREIFEITQ